MALALDDKVVVITGAGSGLGRALAQAFASRCAHVVGIGRTQATIEATGEGTDNYSSHVLDVGNADQVQQVFDAIVAAHGRIDVLFNNAAVYPKQNFLEESAEQWAAATATNINGVAYCCKAVLPTMIEAQFGRIFNVGSWADLSPIRNSAAYSTTKGALHPLTKAIAADVADRNLDIEIHEWLPGHLNTQMTDFTGIDPAVSAQWAVDMVASSNASSKNTIFEHDHERIPPKRLKERIKDKLLFWKR